MLKHIRETTENLGVDQNRNPKSTFRSLTMCKKCYTFYYKKSWHFERPDYLDDYAEQEVPVRFTECPACVEQEVALYNTEYDVESFPVFRRIEI